MIAGSDAVRYLLSAGGVTLLFLLASLWLQRSGASARDRRFVLFIALLFAFFSIHSIQYRLSRLLVGNHRPFEATDVPAGGRVALIVLGYGSKTVENWSGEKFSVVDRHAASRVLEAYRVYRMVHPDIVISSGGNPHPELGHESTGNTMRDALVELGVPRSRIVVETISKTTRDEAVVIAPMLKSLKIDHAVLVTSDEHMRRSLGVFRSVGVRPIPAIAHDIEPFNSLSLSLIPSEHGLTLGSENLHEALGLLYYRLRGWWAQ